MSWNDDSDRDLPLASDLETFGDDAPAELSCPACGLLVSEDASKCPHCGEWMTPGESSAAFSKKWWLAIAVLLMLVAMWRWVF